MTVNLFQYNQKTKQLTPRVSGEKFAAPTDTTFDLTPSGTIGSVQFWWNGSKLQIENREPWRANGDKGSLKFRDGINKLEATVYEKMQGKGRVLLKTAWVFNCPAVQAPDGIVQKLATKGIVCYGSDPLPEATNILKDVSATAVRWWFSTMFKGDVGDGIANDAREWKAEGVKRIVVTCTPPIDTPVAINEAAIRLWARSVRSKWAGLVDAVQIINEANLKKYWMHSIQDAAEITKIVANELKDSGIDVYAPSISRNTTALRELVSTGIGLYVDAFTFHPYGPTADEHINGYKPDPKLKGVKGAAEICGNHKLVITEFGLHAGSFSGWRTEIEKAWQGIKPYVSEAYCYRLVANQQPAGRFGLVTDKALKIRNTETYSQWQGLKV